MAGQARVGEQGPAVMAPPAAKVDQTVQGARVDPKVQGTTRDPAVQVATEDQSILVVQTAREEFAI